MEKTVKQTQTQDSTLLKDLATPISIVIAGFFIALAILFQGDISLNLDALKKAKTTATDTAGVKKLTQGGTVEDKFAEYSKELSLNVQDFTSCLNSGKFKDEVQKDFSDGSTVGVSGTPTLFVNGTKIVGAQPYESFKAAIDKEL